MLRGLIKGIQMIEAFDGETRWLSNFAPCNVVLDGRVYPSTENGYQAAKTTDLGEREQFQSITPGKAKKAGKAVTLRPDWNEVKLLVMEDLNRQKYALCDYREKLLATGDMDIQEGNHWGDTFWGVCNGVGENHLGKIIMRLRAEIKLAT